MRILEYGGLIVFEGGDGCGKSSQYRRAFEYIREKGFDVIKTREPGGGDEKYRELLLHPREPLTPMQEFELFHEDRSILYSHIVIPALENGKIVLSDRSYKSSLAYQGYAGGVDIEYIRSMSLRATRGTEADLILLYDVDPKEAFKRQTERGEKPTWFERKPLEFHQAVREGYLAEAQADANGWRIIDALPDEETVWGRTKKCIDTFFLREFNITL